MTKNYGINGKRKTFMESVQTNPELEQDRAFDTFDHFQKFGFVMFPQQREIYNRLAEVVKDKIVLEVGCGAGIGTAILNRKASLISGTDKNPSNVKFAQELYPWINFYTWDIATPISERYPIIVAVEVLEHIEDVETAFRNLIDAATKEVWFSMPNGKGKKKPPENPYHVREYTINEMIDIVMLINTKLDSIDCRVELDIEIMGYDFSNDLTKDPLVYRIMKTTK